MEDAQQDVVPNVDIPFCSSAQAWNARMGHTTSARELNPESHGRMYAKA